MNIRVLLFEDNDAYRDSLVTLLVLKPGFECVGSFPNCEQAVEKVELLKPDVVLMDVDMPKVNGIEGLTAIRKQFPNLKILMQTVFEDDEKVFACICAGADGYILKKASPTELLAGIEDVMNGGAPMTPAIARKVLKLASLQTPQTKGEVFDLSARELEVLGLLVKGMSYKMIGDKLFISTSTVNSHIRKIYEKLQVHSVSAAVAIAVEKRLV